MFINLIMHLTVFANIDIKGIRGWFAVVKVLNGTCDGDTAAVGAIFEDTIEKYKANCGITELKSVIDIWFIAGDGCGVNLCFGNEIDYFNPPIFNQ